MYTGHYNILRMLVCVCVCVCVCVVDDPKKYWTYLGSLTTPPCYESVRFIIFKNPIHVGKHQVPRVHTLSLGRLVYTIETIDDDCHFP